MTTETIEVKERIFKFDGTNFDDPDPSWTPEQVKEFLSEGLPMLTQAVIEGPEITDEGVIYRFVKAAGTKGGSVSIEDIAKGRAPFPFKNITGTEKIDFNFMSDIARAADSGEGPVILPPSESIGMI